MKEEGLDYLPEELQERFIKTKEYSGIELKELEAYLHPGDMGMYRWGGPQERGQWFNVNLVK